MARVTVAEVRDIIPNTTLTDAQIQAAIDSATLIIDRIAAGCGSNLSEAELKQAELYLSAHLCATSDQSLAVTEEKFENSSRKVGNQGNGAGYLSTSYGETANMLTNGCLAQSQKRKARIYSRGVANVGNNT